MNWPPSQKAHPITPRSRNSSSPETPSFLGTEPPAKIIAEAVNVDLFAYVSGTLLGGLELQFNSGNYLGYTSANDPTGQNYNRVASVPEPSVLALMGIGLAGMGFSRKRMKGA